jgi:hypothetical protein
MLFLSSALRRLSLTLLAALLTLSACSAGGSPAAAAAEGYLRALVAQDETRLVGLSCAAWEAQARQEVASFDAVTAELTGLTCQEAPPPPDLPAGMTLVTCQGTISASYNGEIQEINLADRGLLLTQEASAWRMCGYR